MRMVRVGNIMATIRYIAHCKSFLCKVNLNLSSFITCITGFVALLKFVVFFLLSGFIDFVSFLSYIPFFAKLLKVIMDSPLSIASLERVREKVTRKYSRNAPHSSWKIRHPFLYNWVSIARAFINLVKHPRVHKMAGNIIGGGEHHWGWGTSLGIYWGWGSMEVGDRLHFLGNFSKISTSFQ